MYSKIVLIFLIIIITTFFYLHTVNPTKVEFVITEDYKFNLPITVLIFAGFFVGAALAVCNSIFVDIKRTIRDMRLRREQKVLNQAEDDYRKGVEELLKGDTSKAIQLIQKAIDVKPTVDMYIRLADAYMGEDKRLDAFRVLEQGLLKNPSSLELLTAIARRALRVGDIPRARKALEDILSIAPDNLYALSGLRDIMIEEGVFEEAVKLQRKVVEGTKDETERKKEDNLLTGMMYQVARGYVDEDKLNDAVSKIKEVIKKDDSFVPAHVLLGEVYRRLGNPSSAQKTWESAYEKHPHPIFLIMLEDLCMEESEPSRILDKYTKAIATNPKDVNLKLLRARLYLRLEMVDNAIEELERLAQEGEEGIYHHVLLGEAYLRRNQSEKASALFQKALGFDKEIFPPFRCSVCGYEVRAWYPRCPECRRWNTFEMISPPIKPGNKGGKE